MAEGQVSAEERRPVLLVALSRRRDGKTRMWAPEERHGG